MDIPDNDIIAQGYCGGEGDGTNLSWALTRDGTMTISGTGEMADYEGEGNESPWYEFRDKVTTLKLKEGMTSIGNRAFFGISSDNIVIPETVKQIDSEAFNSSDTTTIAIPKSVEKIDSFAFRLFGADHVIIGAKVIEEYAFWRGSAKHFTLLEGISRIEDFALSDAEESIYIPNSVEYISPSAFHPYTNDPNWLESIEVGSENAAYSSRNGVLYDKNMTQVVIFPMRKQGEYVIPAGMREFNVGLGLHITKITVPVSVRNFGFYPTNGIEPYFNDSYVPDIYYEGTEEQWNQITFLSEDSDWRKYCKVYFMGNILSDCMQYIPFACQLEVTGAMGNGATWSVAEGTLPDGVALSSDGLLSGAAQMNGTFNFTVSISLDNSADETVETRNYMLTVNPVRFVP